MSHRENSITGRSVVSELTVEDFHRATRMMRQAPRESQYPIMIPQNLYDAARLLGHDLTDFAPYKPIPRTPEEWAAYHQAALDAEFGPGSYVRVEPIPARFDMIDHRTGQPIPCPEAALGTRRNVRGYPGGTGKHKHRGTEKDCGGVTCLPGLNGKCVACCDEQ